jgi:monofunctional glycosyltransferase
MRRFLIWLACGWLALTVLPVILLRWAPVPTSSFMLQYRVAGWLAEPPRPAPDYRPVPATAISPWAALAVVAAEDQTFPTHHGFDLAAIERARSYNRQNRRTRGASTLSQQVAKNLFLWPSRSWLRKGAEVYFTLLIETFWPKHRILEVYLNIAEFGPGIYGVEAASQRYWGKPAGRLNADEAALLAAVLPSPRRLRADAPSDYLRSRARQIRVQMHQLGPAYLDALRP